MSNQQYITAVNPVQEPEREKGGRDGANEHVACCLVTAGLPESHSTQRQSGEELEEWGDGWRRERWREVRRRRQRGAERKSWREKKKKTKEDDPAQMAEHYPR